MKLKLVLAAAVLLSAPAFAQGAAASDTVKAIVEKGVSVEIGGFAGNLDYKADGTFSGFDGQYEGTCKVDGSKMCFTSSAVGQDNACFDYPAGKTSGDKFKITDANVGEIEITIK